jgi:hypothetical protein
VADRAAVGGVIAEIDTMAVLTCQDRTIDNPDVEMGARAAVRSIGVTDNTA